MVRAASSQGLRLRQVGSAEHRPAPIDSVPPGAIAQLGERLLCKQEVAGSIPAGSTGESLQIGSLCGDRSVPALVHAASVDHEPLPQARLMPSRQGVRARTGSPNHSRENRTPFTAGGCVPAAVGEHEHTAMLPLIPSELGCVAAALPGKARLRDTSDDRAGLSSDHGLRFAAWRSAEAPAGRRM